MPEDNIEELITEQDGDSSVIKELRGMIKDMHNKKKGSEASVEELQTKLKNIERDNLLLSAGFGKLPERQKNSLIRELESEEDPDVKVVQSIAEELGYKAEQVTNSGTNNETNNNGEQNNAGESGGEEVNEPQATSALEALAVIEKANKAARTGGPAVRDFNQKMKDAKSKEELRAIIQNEGPKNRLIHEFDTI